MGKENSGTKLCKYCKSEIPADAKICPNCRKKQGGKGCLIAVIVVIVIIAIIGMVGGGNSKVDNSKAQTNNSTASNTTQKVESNKQSDTSADDSNTVKIGGTYDGGDIKFTVKDSDLDYQVKDDDYGLYNLDSGLKYVSVDFEFENIGSSDKYVSIYDFDCYADDEACEQQFLPEGGDFINKNLSSGRKVSFTTFYAVPKKASSIELEYDDNLWTNEKIYIKLK